MSSKARYLSTKEYLSALFILFAITALIVWYAVSWIAPNDERLDRDHRPKPQQMIGGRPYGGVIP